MSGCGPFAMRSQASWASVAWANAAFDCEADARNGGVLSEATPGTKTGRGVGGGKPLPAGCGVLGGGGTGCITFAWRGCTPLGGGGNGIDGGMGGTTKLLLDLD